MTDIVELTKQLIAVPSFLGPNDNENRAAEFLFKLLQADSRLTVRKQDLAEGRFNVIAETPGDPTLLLAGHMDTVKLSGGWTKNPLDPTVVGNRLFGLGSLDMKGGIAAIVAAISGATVLPNGLRVLFYCDEEYDFAGMRAFIAQNNEAAPQLAVVAEPSNLEIWNAHRGIVELRIRVRGRSAHASRPNEGINAITATVAACNKVRALLEHQHTALGVTTLNLAGLNGGLHSGSAVSIQANAVPDFAESVLDFRVSNNEFDAKALLALIHQAVVDEGAELEDSEIRHDLGPLLTLPEEIGALTSAIKASGLEVKYADAGQKGYGDGQLMAEHWGIPVANFGPSGQGMHGPDEFVEIDTLYATERVYSELVKAFV